MINTVESRLSQIRNELGITKIKLGELAGAENPSQSVTNWFNRNSISKKAAKKLSENTGYSYLWILDGVGDKKRNESTIKDTNFKAVEYQSTPNNGEFVTAPILDIELSEIDGYQNESEIAEYTLPFQAYTLKNLGIPVEKVRVVKVHGDSMEPKLLDGDTVSINTLDKRIKDGKIYAIRIGNLQKVKVLIQNYDGSITIRSFNQSFEDEIISKDKIESGDFEVLGRVWWVSSII